MQTPLPSITTYYLIIKIGAIQFGIEAKLIQEIVKLPEISPVEEMSSYIRGLVNLRGRVIPVMDLNLRLGRRSPVYKLSDALLILHYHDNALGIICNEVLEVIELSSTDIESIHGLHGEDSVKPRLINAVARTDSSLILLIDPMQLFHFSPIEMLDQEIMDEALSNSEIRDNDLQISTAYNTFFTGMNEEEKQEFKKRAQQLKKVLISEELNDSIPLAIVKLANELLAVELKATEGFATLSRLTPIPCCPTHIMGSMNLRGDNLTIVDIRSSLNISYTQESHPTNIMIVKCDNYSLGVSIDEIVDIVHLQTDAINKMPSTIDIENRQYLKGMAKYAEQMLAVVNMPKLLARPELIVYEEI